MEKECKLCHESVTRKRSGTNEAVQLALEIQWFRRRIQRCGQPPSLLCSFYLDIDTDTVAAVAGPEGPTFAAFEVIKVRVDSRLWLGRLLAHWQAISPSRLSVSNKWGRPEQVAWNCLASCCSGETTQVKAKKFSPVSQSVRQSVSLPCQFFKAQHSDSDRAQRLWFISKRTWQEKLLRGANVTSDLFDLEPNKFEL